jgi:hypothetical protein
MQDDPKTFQRLQVYIEIVTDMRQDSELLGFWTSSIVHPLILSVIHHRPNPLESTCTPGMDTAYTLDSVVS